LEDQLFLAQQLTDESNQTTDEKEKEIRQLKNQITRMAKNETFTFSRKDYSPGF